MAIPVIKSYLGNILYSPKLVENQLIESLDQFTNINDGGSILYLRQIDVSELLKRDFQSLTISDLYDTNIEAQDNDASINLISMRPMGINDPLLSTSWTELQFESTSGRKTISVSNILDRIVCEHTQRQKKSRHISYFVSPSCEVPMYAHYKKVMKSHEKTFKWFKQSRDFINQSQLSEAHKSEYILFGVAFPQRYPMVRASNINNHNINSSSSSSNNDSGERAALQELRICFADSAKNLIDLGAQGVCIGGAGMGESAEELRAAISGVKSITSVSNTPILIQGMDTLEQILVALGEGCDLVSSNFPSALSERCMSVHWHLDNNSDNNNKSDNDNSDGNKSLMKTVPASSSSSPPQFSLPTVAAAAAAPTMSPAMAVSNLLKVSLDDISDNGEDGEHATLVPKKKKQKLSTSSSSSVKDIDTNNETAELMRKQAMLKYCINISDKHYERDPNPLLDGCLCHACRNHSRAYIHHLYCAKEILFDVLLYQHNVYQFLRLFQISKNISKFESENQFKIWLEYILKNYI